MTLSRGPAKVIAATDEQAALTGPAKSALGSPTFMASKGTVPWTRTPHTRRPVHCHSAGM